MADSMSQVERLKSEVLQRFGRTLDAPTDYDALSLDILKKCGEQVSASTLKRLYGYNKQTTTPRPSTLSTLARYAGYTGWSHFCNESDCNPVRNSRKWLWWWLAGVLLLLGVAGVLWVIRPGAKPLAEQVSESVSTPEYPYDTIRRKWVGLTLHKCDSIRQYRSTRDVFAYAELIDEFYYPFVFAELKAGLSRDVAALDTQDSLSDNIAREEIFAVCRDLCIELSREIADELRMEGQKRVEAQYREIQRPK